MCECALKIILLCNICLSPATIYRPKLYALARSGRRATEGENNDDDDDDDDVDNKPHVAVDLSMIVVRSRFTNF